MISQNLKERFLTSFFLIVLIILFTKYDFFLVYTLIVLGVLSVIEFLDITKKITANKLYLLISNLSFVSYIFFGISCDFLNYGIFHHFPGILWKTQTFFWKIHVIFGFLLF